ncbi:MAG: hypothetical protein SGJ20_17480 [Planctomycetota bacterium]|nr:hypothetical protein [Planctomycetota bacterium]
MRSKHLYLVVCGLFFCSAVLVGCSKSDPNSGTGASAAGSKFLLTAEPQNAKGIKEARGSTQDAEEITVVGRIGGDTDPWVKGQAAFLVVDTALKPCNEKDDDACTTPWDYCCDSDTLPDNKAMVKFVDANGSTVATDARELLGVKELQTVVVQGKAKRDESGNLTLLATGIFVRN